MLPTQSKRDRAIEAAAIQHVGWGRDRNEYKLSPEEHWQWRRENLPPTANQAALEIATGIIEAYERVMAEED